MNKINYCLSKRHCDVISSNLVTDFWKLDSISAWTFFNAEKSVGGHVKVYNFIVFQQNDISLGT